MDPTSLTFGKSLLSGVWEAGVGMVEGIGELAVSGYQIATDANARATAWQSTQAIAAEAAIYGDAVIDDPAKLYRDARDGTLAVYDHFEQAKALAEKEGRLAEFYGEMTGKAIFEVGTILIPVGKLAKAGKLGKAAEVADEVADTGKKIETAEDILSPAKKAQKTIEQPLSKERNEPVSAIQRCPVRECDKVDEGKNSPPLRESTRATFLNGKAKRVVLDEPLTVYRAHGGKAAKEGRFATADVFKSRVDARNDLALVQEWGNSITKMTKVELPKGTTVWKGKAAPQVGKNGKTLPGGGSQIFIDGELNSSWFIGTNWFRSDKGKN